MGDPDLELLTAWRGGERSAGDELMRRYYRRVLGFFRMRVPAVAEDLAQQTFLTCAEAQDNIDGGTFGGFLFGIARNILLRQLRAYAKNPDDIPVPPPQSTLSPSRVSRMRQEHWLLMRALEKLPDDVQITMALHYVQGLKVREVGEALGVPTSTVTTRIARAREALRTAVNELKAADKTRAVLASDLERWTQSLGSLLSEDDEAPPSGG